MTTPLAFLYIESQFDNLGDALINRELLKLMAEHGEVTAGISCVPLSFQKMMGLDFLNSLNLDRTNSRSRFLLTILSKALRGKRCYLFLSPGGWIGELDGRLNLRSWVHTALYYTLALCGVRICQVGISYEDLGFKLSLMLRSRSRAMHSHYVRDPLSQKTMTDMAVRIDGICPDLAFYAFDNNQAQSNPDAVTFSFRADQYAGQLDDIKQFIALFLAYYGVERPIYFVSQVKKDAPYNKELALWVTETYGVATDADDGSEVIADTEALYRRSSVMVSNRLHSLLLAGSVGNAMVAAPITQHNKKITALFDEIGLAHHVFTAEDMQARATVENIQRICGERFDASEEKRELSGHFDRLFNSAGKK